MPGKRGGGRWLVILAAFAIVAATYSRWLAWSGHLLVRSDAPSKADFIVVLAGDWTCGRILRAAELARAGHAPKVLVSSPMRLYGEAESDLAIRCAVRRGFEASLFEAIPLEATSTQVEAGGILADARRRGARSLLVVTSDFHTRRARRIFDRLRGDLDVRVTEAGYPYFDPDAWWQSREGRKTWLLEFTKLVTGTFGI